MTPGDLKKEGARIWCDRINAQSDPDRINVNEGEVQPGVVFEVDLEAPELGVKIHCSIGGAEVAFVAAGGAADDLGIQVGDLITSVGTKEYDPTTEVSWSLTHSLTHSLSQRWSPSPSLT
jgi:S1-C subfamily serine protease